MSAKTATQVGDPITYYGHNLKLEVRATHGDSSRKSHCNTNAHAMGPHALPKRAPYAHAHESMVTFMYHYRRARV